MYKRQAFVIVPDTIMKALFMRGAFSEVDALQSARALAAYGAGLAALVLIRPLTVTFHSRGDTTTPVIAVAVAIAINVALKFALMGPLGHVGLATATSVGAWVNLSLLVLFARRKDLFTLDERARRVLPKLLASFAVLAATLLGMVFALRTVMGGGLNDKVALAALMATGGIAYGATLILLFGKEFVGDLKRLRRGIGG